MGPRGAGISPDVPGWFDGIDPILARPRTKVFYKAEMAEFV